MVDLERCLRITGFFGHWGGLALRIPLIAGAPQPVRHHAAVLLSSALGKFAAAVPARRNDLLLGYRRSLLILLTSLERTVLMAALDNDIRDG